MHGSTRALLASLSFASCSLLWMLDAMPLTRADVFYTLDFETVSPVVNPKDWEAGMRAAHDGLDPVHIALYDQPKGDWSPAGAGGTAEDDINRTAAVRSLRHLEVIANGKNPSPL